MEYETPNEEIEGYWEYMCLRPLDLEGTEVSDLSSKVSLDLKYFLKTL